MRHDSRLSRMLHVLIHMDGLKTPATSDTIAAMLDTNPVVVRRTMAGLRERGYVKSGKGHGGGWTLARPLAAITLLDIHHALGDPPVFALGTTDEHADCLVERAVSATLGDAMREAERMLLDRFGRVTLADLAARVQAPQGSRES
jgi:DNA-binding IscR family transcriptional regulator